MAAGSRDGWLDRVMTAVALRRWGRAAEAAPETDLPRLRRQRAAARRLKTRLDRLLQVAEARLALPLIGSQAFPRPQDADWAWRPDPWCGPLPVQGLCPARSPARLAEGTVLFHDCPRADIVLRQIRNTRDADLAACGLKLEVFRFEGSYLSLAVDLPEAAAQGLKRRHLLRVEALVEMERPVEILARLNIRHGPNTEQIVRELPLQGDRARVEFDLAYARLNEKRVDHLWLDLIFEGPEMSQVILRDLTFCRRPRAEL
ncbi:DUF6478 family protein [Salipiger marinus]|uniref:Uncharacterized protein n=1 Tax=Salipiger marinus TaxID=555512 RepID=A0A1G8NNU2_9RHOB|nr:DUF6478 family protein [Salipiger marinus]SDI81802.1 hypothetical protein SAMN04487993_1010169 [Salipiger marinus]